MANRTCSIDGCERITGVPGTARGLCSAHYTRVLRHGDPDHAQRIVLDDAARFWSKVDRDGAVPPWAPFLGKCWVWTSPLSDSGYASMGVDGAKVRAHRYAYEMLVGPIPEGLTIDHLCRVRHCVNPAHMEPVTQAENSRRARFADRRSVAA